MGTPEGSTKINSTETNLIVPVRAASCLMVGTIGSVGFIKLIEQTIETIVNNPPLGVVELLASCGSLASVGGSAVALVVFMDKSLAPYDPNNYDKPVVSNTMPAKRNSRLFFRNY